MKLKATILSAGLTLISAGIIRADIMPSFVGAPVGWTVDRYAPASFGDVGTYQGRNDVLGIGISSAQDFTNRPAPYQSTFYNTQGMSYAVSGGAGSELDADLYVPGSWSDPSVSGSVRTDMWAVMTDASSSITDYPIIGFTNYGGAARFRVWNENLNSGNGAWVDLTTPVTYNAWNALGIQFDGTSMDFFVNGSEVYSYLEDPTTTGFSRTIMQAYNFGGDPSISGANAQNYTAYWSNATSLPEPSPATLLSTALLGLAALRIKLKTRR